MINVNANCDAMESIFSKEFDGVFVKADEDDHGRPDESDEKENLKNPNSNKCK